MQRATFLGRHSSCCILLFLASLFNLTNGASFLILHPFSSGSHVLTLHAVTEQLISRGHHVTTVRFSDPSNLQLSPMGHNHTEIVLYLNNSDGSIPCTNVGEKGQFALPMSLLWSAGLSVSTLATFMYQEGSPWTVFDAYCHALLGNEEMVRRLEDGRFDVAIVDLVYNECGLGLASHLGLPTVVYWAFSFSGGEAEFSAAATPASHVPAFMSRLTQDMSFAGRIYNALKKAFSRVIMCYHTWRCDGFISRHFEEVPSTRQLLADLNGALLNTDCVLDYPRLQPETFLNVGGLQISKGVKALPKQIHDWIAGAEHGVVLFTMGFVFDPAHVPKPRVDALLAAFARLPQRVIVKFDSAVDNAPDNVLVLPFVPQQDILAHPKTRVFVTHCGMHGVMEAIHHRVPMVGMPVFIDQGDVAVRMREKGIGMIIDKLASEEEVYQAIVKVRDDKKFKKSIDALSDLMRMRRNHPMDDAVWLLEFVARTKGADHLRLGSRKLNFLQYYSLDVVAFLVLGAWLMVKVLGRMCCSRGGGRRKGKME